MADAIQDGLPALTSARVAAKVDMLFDMLK